MCLVNFSFCLGVNLFAMKQMGLVDAYFQDDKTVTVIAPPHYTFVAGVLEHPEFALVNTGASVWTQARLDVLVQLAHKVARVVGAASTALVGVHGAG